MRDTFIAALETQHDLGKRSDTGFIPETWAFYVGEVQKVCLGTETTPIEKAENKLDTVYILHSSKGCLLVFLMEIAMERLGMGRKTIWDWKGPRDREIHRSGHHMGRYHREEIPSKYPPYMFTA